MTGVSLASGHHSPSPWTQDPLTQDGRRVIRQLTRAWARHEQHSHPPPTIFNYINICRDSKPPLNGCEFQVAQNRLKLTSVWAIRCIAEGSPTGREMGSCPLPHFRAATPNPYLSPLQSRFVAEESSCLSNAFILNLSVFQDLKNAGSKQSNLCTLVTFMIL
jgi:hypothetical protein